MKRVVFYALIALFLLATFNSLYKYLNKPTAKSTRLACHQGVVVFEKVYLPDQLSILKNQLKSGEFTLDFSVQKAVYMESKLFDFVSADQVKKSIEEIFDHKKDSEKLLIKALLYENDLKDAGKKSKEAFLYAGYLVFGFVYENKLVYKVQIDFMDKKGADIDKTISCAKESLLSI